MKRNKKFTLHASFTLLIFLTLLGSGIVAILTYVIINAVRPETSLLHTPIILILISYAASSLLGTLVSMFFSRHVLNPVEKVIDAIHKVAKGDFSVRVRSDSDEIAELEQSFNDMAEELGSNELFKNDFINNFSHEFKTPIVSIRGFANRLKKDDLSDELRRQYAGIIAEEADRLAVMASNVLLLTKFENQKIVSDKTLFRVDEQIRKAILLFEKQWSEKNIDLDIQLCEVSYYSNEEMLSHVWINLLSNAVKFSPEGSTIRIYCEGTDDGGISFVISDSGCGMDEKTQKRIFDKFYQGDPAHSGMGNGLGLSLVQRILTLCGGGISVRSAPGEGSEFTVTLPGQNVPAGE